MKIQAFSVPPQIQSEDFTSKINRQNLPISNSVDNKEHINFEGFTKCLTYQMALAGGADRAYAENPEKTPVSNAPRTAFTTSDDLPNQDSVGLIKCLTYQMALAAEIDRQTILQKQILRQETKGLLDSKN
jgi:hypothetical protein